MADLGPVAALRMQFMAIRPWLVVILIISTGMVGMVFLVHHLTGFPIGGMTRDLASTGGVPPFAGFLSQWGLFLWAATCAICLFSAALLRRLDRAGQSIRFLVSAGLLSAVLGIDDAFQLHENVLPYFGVREIVTFSFYIICVLFFLIGFRCYILTTEYLLLGLALLFFAISMTLDMFLPSGWNKWLHEDSTRFFGILTWLVYFVRTGMSAAQQDRASH